MGYFLAVVAAIVVGAIVGRALIRSSTVMSYERGMLYRRGFFTAVLGPGKYWYMPFFTTITKVDARARSVSVGGQELLTSDGIALKISLAAEYQVTDPERAVNSVVNYETALYQQLQLALRAIIESMDAEKVLSTRAEINGQLMELAQPRAGHLGIQLTMVAIKDLMLPGKLKEVFAQVVRARQDGFAALERARGETATLRHLANAAKMLDAHPGLLHLRLAQVIGSGSGNSIVLGVPPEAATVKKRPPTK